VSRTDRKDQWRIAKLIKVSGGLFFSLERVL
jgi:hypothetical protein